MDAPVRSSERTPYRAWRWGTRQKSDRERIFNGRSRRSLSLPSAHAYSMAPEYARRFAQRHRLRRPRRNVKRCLISKLKSCLRGPILPEVHYWVRCGSALRCGRLFPRIRGKVDIILTSPPYLNAQTYAKDNWLRLWLLRYDHRSLQRDYIETGSVRMYERLMTRVLQQLSRMLRRGGLLICVAGDVRLRREQPIRCHPCSRLDVLPMYPVCTWPPAIAGHRWRPPAPTGA